MDRLDQRRKASKLDNTQKKQAVIKDTIPDTETFDDELDKNETAGFDLFDQKEKYQHPL